MRRRKVLKSMRVQYPAPWAPDPAIPFIVGTVSPLGVDCLPIIEALIEALANAGGLLPVTGSVTDAEVAALLLGGSFNVRLYRSRQWTRQQYGGAAIAGDPGLDELRTSYAVAVTVHHECRAALIEVGPCGKAVGEGTGRCLNQASFKLALSDTQPAYTTALLRSLCEEVCHGSTGISVARAVLLQTCVESLCNPPGGLRTPFLVIAEGCRLYDDIDP
jgi:hypothetical protein